MFLLSVLAAGDDPKPRPRVQFEAAATVASVAAGSTFEVVCTLTVPPKWHIYWKDPGSSGMATRVRVQAPPGFKVGRVRYPAPVTMHDPAGPVNALDGHVRCAVPLTAPMTLPVSGEVVIEVEADWLVCQKACFLGDGKATLRVPVTAQPGPATAAAAWATALPRPIQERPGTTVTMLQGPVLRIEGPRDPANSPTFLVASRPGVVVGVVRTHTDGEGFVMKVPLRFDSGEGLGQPPRITGLVRFGVGRGDPAWEVDFPFNTEPKKETEQAP